MYIRIFTQYKPYDRRVRNCNCLSGFKIYIHAPLLHIKFTIMPTSKSFYQYMYICGSATIVLLNTYISSITLWNLLQICAYFARFYTAP